MEKNKGEIVVYQPDAITRLDVRIENDNVWLNRIQLAVLFGRDIKTIGKHISNALKEELNSIPTVANFATVQKEGTRYVERQIEYYNLDMILSVGYRVKSEKGILFRRWANQVLKDYLWKGYSINNRMRLLESHFDKRIADCEKRLDAQEKQIDFLSERLLLPLKACSMMDRFLMHMCLLRTTPSMLL
ncbi:MAG: virulence RhuM family protein [Bacteroidales bacterium]|nr:virulence RhuM family protein [Bacteroidales bacterium]